MKQYQFTVSSKVSQVYHTQASKQEKFLNIFEQIGTFADLTIIKEQFLYFSLATNIL